MKKQIILSLIVLSIFAGIAARVGIIESPIFGTSATFSYGTASTVPYLDASKNLISSAVTPTELGYVSGVTSSIQTQIDGIGSGTGKLIVEDSGYGLDNSSVGRGTVGTEAVSLEYSDSGSTFGATGDNSTVSGGEVNTASGLESTVSGGALNTASGLNSTVSGGGTNTASGDFSVVHGTLLATASHFGESALSPGNWGTGSGNCQRGSVQARIETSTTSEAELFLDNSTARFTLDDNDAYTCKITILGAQADGSIGDAVYQIKIKRQGATTSLSQSLQTILAWNGDTNIGTPTFAITADDTNEALKITVTPANTTATRWTAALKYVKINY